ncbi:MAG: hypothetical protein HC789_00695 [Microcoleus sp. CSU_2_2]|nr:hypothetical protein [Microcoleus sp. SU_5_3]NJS08982.1 hypothetical protein [Microcoleus sp. CSU_2_2]
MKSTLCFPETSLHSNTVDVDKNAIESCIAAAWFDLIGGNFEAVAGDDWLPLCGDIDEGEIYREWFLWQDREVSSEWEAYDPITNDRVVALTKEMLIAKIDRIEDARQV